MSDEKPTIVVTSKADVVRLWEAHEKSITSPFVQFNGMSTIAIEHGFMFETKWFKIRYEDPARSAPAKPMIPDWAWSATASTEEDVRVSDGDDSHDELWCDREKVARLIYDTRINTIREACRAIRLNPSGTYKVVDLEAVEALIGKDPS